MKITVIGSSSAGNCYILRGVQSSLLLEAGVGYKEIATALGHDFSRVAGCLVTHEHMDHAKAVHHLAKKGIDIYASRGTFGAIDFTGHRANALRAKKVAKIGEFDVLPFDVQHDAAEPFGYLIQSRITKEKVCFITDTYYTKYRFSGVTCYMVEANYSESILLRNIESGCVPGPMADRTRRSHFEIGRVVEFLKASDLTRTRKIVLLHMSSGNSDAEAFRRLVYSETNVETIVSAKGIEITV